MKCQLFYSLKIFQLFFSKIEAKCVIMSSDEGIREAGEILMTISDDEREWAIQEMRYKAEVDREAFRIAAHDKGLEEGRKEGLELGRTEGRAEGRAEGRTEGKTEGKAEAKIEDALGMKEEGIPTETIVKITGLTAEQVEAL